MQLSWSQKLFLQINQSLGKRPCLDKLMEFCAQWLIYILVFVVLLWSVNFLSAEDFKLLIKLLLTALFFNILTSWFLATIWSHGRPVTELAEVKELIKPCQSWKGFPSDHTSISFILAIMLALVGASLYGIIILLMLAILVALARVYVGVHYPRDIVGGIVFALFFSFFSFWLLEKIVQPLYNYLLNLL